VRYRELPVPADLGPWLRCAWVLVPDGDGGPGWVVPDGCLDIIWYGGRVIVAGPDDVPEFHPPVGGGHPGGPVIGVRFRPGRAAPLLREAPARLRNQRVPLADLGPLAVDGLVERLAARPDPAPAVTLLIDEVRRRAAGAREPEPVAAGAADLILAAGGRRGMGEVAAELAVSERHLRRRSTEALGYGPKTFARIVRFQQALAMFHRADRPGLATVAAAAGYADQAHLTREVGELAGRTPGEIMAGSPAGRAAALS
jgi:AraC-like DNA-binding protein